MLAPTECQFMQPGHKPVQTLKQMIGFSLALLTLPPALAHRMRAGAKWGLQCGDMLDNVF
jgi:hypothetical protein